MTAGRHDDAEVRAAGILFVSGNGNALFLKRASSARDYPGCWGFPGGAVEGDETIEQCALRECREEIGLVPEGNLIPHTRQNTQTMRGTVTMPPLPAEANPANTPAHVMPAVDFTTYVQKVGEEFTPQLNDEHDGWAWAPLASPPQPLHPGCQVALDRLTMNELDVARAIADGRLTSPQRYENVWLFAIRITGTGYAYRPKHNEFVLRRPENYLNADFLARCNGMAVTVRHAAKAVIENGEEYSELNVGSIFLPYIAGDEVWGIAKIYDDDAAERMLGGELSTSPAVFFRDLSVNQKLTLENGAKLLIEGDPSFVDHVALCERGVWDKGEEPSGIRSESRKDSAMTEEEKKAAEEKAKKDAEETETRKKADADKAKADADVGKKIDAIADSLGGLHKRMDAMEETDKKRCDAEEKARKDAEEEKRKAGDPEQLAADKAKKDAAEAEKMAAEDKAKKDAEEKAKADAADIKKRIDEVAKMVAPIADDDHHALADAWSRADDVFSALGKQTPRAIPGETAKLYRRRVTKLLKEHSPTWKNVDLGSAAFADDAAFGIAETQVLSEAMKAAMSPATVPNGGLRMITKKENGHTYNSFVGDTAWMNTFAGPVKLKAEGGWKTRGLSD